MSKFISQIIGWVILAVIAVLVLQSGVLDALIGSLASTVADLLHKVLIALALPAILAGAIVAISPKQRHLGIEIAIGGVTALAVALLAPEALQALQSVINSNPFSGGSLG